MIFEEYRHIKIWPSKNNVKDPEEPFFNKPKYNYKMQKSIFGDDYRKNYELIRIDVETIDNLLRRSEIAINRDIDPYGEENWGDISENLIFVFGRIRKIAIGYEKGYEVSKYLVFEDFLNSADLHKLKEFGFGIYIYDDSGEGSDYFGDKYRISWEWKN
jgi:hypothetical protein